jgi:hypothetical protein
MGSTNSLEIAGYSCNPQENKEIAEIKNIFLDRFISSLHIEEYILIRRKILGLFPRSLFLLLVKTNKTYKMVMACIKNNFAAMGIAGSVLFLPS